MLLSNLEYVPLRLIRRFLLTNEMLLRFGHWLPYYRVNQNQVDPGTIVDRYVSLLATRKRAIASAVVLEIGAGSTNSTAYALAARERVQHVYVCEPFVKLITALDDRFLAKGAAASGRSAEEIRNTVTRLAKTTAIRSRSVDVILSHSVLEHVSDPGPLFAELFRLLKPTGVMIHIIDYRDHFFKYPYHFLQFSNKTWNRFLNPGDLSRRRIGDHLGLMREAGFDPIVLETTQDEDAFRKIRPHLSAEYIPADPELAIQSAAIFATPVDAHPAH